MRTFMSREVGPFLFATSPPAVRWVSMFAIWNLVFVKFFVYLFIMHYGMNWLKICTDLFTDLSCYKKKGEKPGKARNTSHNP